MPALLVTWHRDADEVLVYSFDFLWINTQQRDFGSTKKELPKAHSL